MRSFSDKAIEKVKTHKSISIDISFSKIAPFMG